MIPGSPLWTVTEASRLGSVHQRDHRPLQDSARAWSEGPNAVIAVADGHGHSLHFRSHVGADLATDRAVAALTAVLPGWTDVERARAELPGVAAAVVSAWTNAVLDHLAGEPFAPGDPVDIASATGPLQPYGTTLLGLGANEHVLAAFQIGDGDTVAVHGDGTAFRPIPEDPALDGVHTPSLCQPDPMSALRLAVLDPAADDVVLAFVCTDGFGGSRVDSDGWWRETGTQLLEFARDRGLPWVAEQLPGWLEEPALVGGDDTSLALLAAAALDAPAAPGTMPTDLP